MNLTKLERKMLINQFEIRKRLKETDDYDRVIAILEDDTPSGTTTPLLAFMKRSPQRTTNSY